MFARSRVPSFFSVVRGFHPAGGAVVVVLHPLQKLEVVQRSRLDQLVDLDVPRDLKFVEHGLEYLVVVDHLVLGFSVDVYFAHVDDAGIGGVEDLAVHRAGCHLGRSWVGVWVVDVSDAGSGMGTGRVRPSVRVVFSVWGVPSACVNFKARWWWGDDAGTVAVEVTRLLHFGEFEVEQAVDPVEELRASHEERGMLEPDGRRVRRSHRRDLDSGGDGARWFAVRACDAGFGVDDDDARARCS